MKRLLGILLSITVVSSSVFISPQANAANKSIKNLWFSISYPATVKMPKGDCGTISIQYALGLRAKAAYGRGDYGLIFAYIYWDEDKATGGEYIVGTGNGFDDLLQLQDKGTFAWKFCKTDYWNENQEARIGLAPGTYKIGFKTNFYDEKLEKFSTIKFVK